MKNIEILKNNIKIDYSKEINNIEELIYVGKTEKERQDLIDLNILKITENTINELIKTDLEVRKVDNIWLTKNLDSLYQIKLDHLKISEKESKKILPRTKDHTLRIKIIHINVIISSLNRVDGIILYNKTIKDDYPEEISSKINFTKGYLVCFDKKCVEVFKNYEYSRKKINYEPVIIKEIESNNKKVLDVLDNTNFSSPIWIKKNLISKDNLLKLKIYNKDILNNHFDVKKILGVINFLNKTKIEINLEIFEIIDKVANKSSILDNSVISKNSLINGIYQIGKEIEDVLIDDSSNFEKNNQIKAFINCAAVYELIKKQVNDIGNKTFYMNYILDSRTRIYSDNWPMNYQLNHVVRNIINLRAKHSIKNVYIEFINNEYINEIIKDYKILLIDKINTNTKKKLIDYINKHFKWKITNPSDLEQKIKIEILIILMKKITEKINTNNDKSINIALEFINNFTNDDIEKNIEIWTKKLKIKKIPLIISLQNTLKNIKEDVFDGMYWGDASSNAIQLITLRLGNLNEELLMLTNISENETKHSNIYEYITEKIRELNHKEVIKKLSGKLTKEEIDILQNNNDNKYRIMPASYGMGRHKNLKNMESLLQDRKEIWEKLSDKEKRIVADYFWDNTFEILKNIGFDLKLYREICKSIGEYDIYAWYNDYGLPVVPTNIQTSNRQSILQEINKLKQKLKNEIDQKKIEKIKNKLTKKTKERELDDKNYWKRTMVKIKKDKKEKNIYVRIYHPKIKINKRETRQALVPNSIHSYDASVIAFVIELCKIFDIEIVVIHDSIGCNIIYAPIIKILFKIANIIIIEKNIKNPPFPFNDIKTKENYKLNSEDKIKNLKKQILESSNIFR